MVSAVNAMITPSSERAGMSRCPRQTARLRPSRYYWTGMITGMARTDKARRPIAAVASSCQQRCSDSVSADVPIPGEYMDPCRAAGS